MTIPRRDALKGLGALALGGSGALAGCGRRDDPDGPLNFWAMGREAEVVAALLPEFHARAPGVKVRVQQVPFSAAHEKLLTAYAGGSLPDMCQLGNTWLPEFTALDALEPLDARVNASTIERSDYFAGILDTNVMPTPHGRAPVRFAVVRRHAAALLSHRPAACRRLRAAAADLGRMAWTRCAPSSDAAAGAASVHCCR